MSAEEIKRRNDEGVITYTSGNSLTYSKQPDGNYTFDYFSKGNRIRLNDLAPPLWKFFSVDSNFRILLRESINWSVLSFPEVHLSIPGLRFPGLGEDELSILAALHEIGHATLEEKLLEVLASHSLDGLTEGQISLQVLHKPRRCVVPDSVPKLPELKGTYGERVYASHNFLNICLLPLNIFQNDMHGHMPSGQQEG
ncbi:hypothetical protein HY637_03875 [Candidatus Woesearchaeota archaeon]|nr:hypothetical protein [Candidatus Woesearchaeota archaeon]